MAIILLHSSKTMRHTPAKHMPLDMPQLQSSADELVRYLQTLRPAELKTVMHISDALAHTVYDLYVQRNALPQLPAIDAFLGDIYSGLRAVEFTIQERRYAHDHLLILSGLYGGLRACDGIQPYRLEMGYKLPDDPYRNLYAFWNTRIATLIPPSSIIINLSAVEYTKALLPHLEDPRVITPKFLTISPRTGKPTFVTVHAKIARGAFARWLIQSQYQDVDALSDFADLGYQYDPSLSTPTEPVFVCQVFEGLGLSVRLTN